MCVSVRLSVEYLFVTSLFVLPLDKLCTPTSVDRRDSATRVFDIIDHSRSAATAA